MKKKKMIIITFVIAFLIGIICIDNKEVKADESGESCTTYINYYLMMDAITYNEYKKMGESGVHKTIKTFSLGVGDDIVLSKVTKGLVEVDKNSVDSTDLTTSMSLKTFYDYFYNSTNDKAEEKSMGNYVIRYIRAEEWYNSEGAQTTVTPISETYEEFVTRVPDIIRTPEFDKPSISSDSASINIERSWELTDFTTASQEPNKSIFSPAVYYAKYEDCENTYQTKAHYILKSSNKELGSQVIEKSLSDGSKYSAYTCPGTYTANNVTYIRSETDKYEFPEGTINGKNVDFNCYYTEKKYTLTVNYGINSDCTEGTDIRKSESTEHVGGESVSYTIPSISGYEFSNVGYISPSTKIKDNGSNLAFTMPNKNTSICLVYIKNSKTGVNWIYFVWVIGIAALGYSLWYFTKHNNGNSEI